MPGWIRECDWVHRRSAPLSLADTAAKRPGRFLPGDPLAILALALLCAAGILALAAPVLPLSDPNAIDVMHRLEAPSFAHPLGTDNLGRDLFSRIIWGSRSSLGTVAVATALIVAIAVPIGIVAGYYGGIVDEVLMRIVDVFLALPSLLLALAIGGILGPGFRSVLIALVAVWWASYARVVRGLVIGMREREFLLAARALGGGDYHVMTHHVLANVLLPVGVLATIEMGDLVLAVAALGFLGVGVQAPNADWGTMVNDARPLLFSAPRLMLYPGLAIAVAVIAFNILGDGLRDALDPRTGPRPG
ncbi:MAG: ABC transporter permease [Gemmatimonadaceae bacterium]